MQSTGIYTCLKVYVIEDCWNHHHRGPAVGRQQGGWANCTQCSASLISTCSFLGLHWTPGALRPAGVGWRAGKHFCLLSVLSVLHHPSTSTLLGRLPAEDMHPLRGAPGQVRVVGGGAGNSVCGRDKVEGPQAMCSRYLVGTETREGTLQRSLTSNRHLYSKYDFCGDGQLAVL